MTGTLTEPAASSAPRPSEPHQAERPPAPERISPPMPGDRLWGWLGPLIVTAFAGLLRFWNLGQPRVFSFDETYYAKDALSLLRFHYEQSTRPDANDLILHGNTKVFTGFAEFVVHPPVGKWVIAVGEQIFGVTPFGWRFMPAVLGTLAVLVVARVVRRMTRSTLLGCLAGLLLAVDGLSIVLSRSALLDGPLAFFVITAFAALVIDRDRARERIAGWVAARGEEVLPVDDYGPRLGWRPWRLAAGLLLGLACATKWSGIWYVVAFGILTVLWDLGARRAAGVPSPILATLRRDVGGAFASIVPVAFVVYVVAWVPWLLTYAQQKRDDWVVTARGPSWVPESWRALLDYHRQMWHFHTTLDSPHPYAAKAIGWLLQVRPTAFWSQNDIAAGTQGCPVGPSTCTREVTSIGTPLLWWGACIALVWLVWRWAGARDWRAGAVLAGVLAGWLPWVVLYRDRTIFTFYSVVFAPFMVMAVVLLLGQLIGDRDTVSPVRRTWGAAVSGGYVLLVIANAAWLWPLFVGDLLTYGDWLRRLWFRGWI